jgi:hypothetical protein
MNGANAASEIKFYDSNVFTKGAVTYVRADLVIGETIRSAWGQSVDGLPMAAHDAVNKLIGHNERLYIHRVEAKSKEMTRVRVEYRVGGNKYTAVASHPDETNAWILAIIDAVQQMLWGEPKHQQGGRS